MLPISPAEVKEKRLANIPGFVIEVVNDLIVQEGGGDVITIKRDVIRDAIQARVEYQDLVSNQLPHDIYKLGWLDFEPHYRRVGWDVKYDAPAYNENYSAHYRFTVR